MSKSNWNIQDYYTKKYLTNKKRKRLSFVTEAEADQYLVDTYTSVSRGLYVIIDNTEEEITK